MLEIPLPKTAASTVQPVSAAMACAAATVSQETRFSLPSRCSTTTRIVFAILFSYVPFLAEAHHHEHQRDQNVSAEDDAHHYVSGANVPVDEESPAQRGEQHDKAYHDQRRPCFTSGYREVITAFRIVFHRSEERRVGKECRSRWSPDN